MNFKDIVIELDGHTLLATSVSISEDYSLAPSKSLGIQGDGFGLSANDRKVGSASIQYYLREDDSFLRNKTGISLFNGKIGTTQFGSGLLTSYSLKAEPFSIIEVSASVSFYNGISSTLSGSALTGDNFVLMDGENTTADASIGFNNNYLSISYEMSQNFEPTYTIGSVAPESFVRTNGLISASFDGTGLPSAITWPCPSEIDVEISVGSLCGDTFTIEVANMKPSSVSLEGRVGDDLVGSATLQKSF